MARLGAAIVLLIAIATAFLLWNQQDPPPADTGNRTGDAHANAQPATAATGDAAVAEGAATPQRQAVPLDPNAPVYIVRGVVLSDDRSPNLTQVRVLGYEGAAGDTGGMMSSAMMGRGRSASSPAFMVRGEPIAEVSVAADGSFELQSPSRHLRLTIDHDLYLLATPEIVHVPTATRATDVVLSPLLGGMVRGRLLGERAAEVRRITLQLEANPMAALRDARAMMAAMMAATRPAATALQDQTFVFRGVAPGADLKFAVTGGSAAANHTETALLPGEVRDVVLPVTMAAMLSVEVLDENGETIKGANVRAKPMDGNGMLAMTRTRHQSTNDNGVSLFENIEPGTYYVDALVSGRTGNGQEIEVIADDEAKQVRLIVTEGGVVTGTVKDADGKPIANARVAHQPMQDIPMLGDLTEQLGPEFLSQVTRGGAETDEQGRFRLTGLADEGEFLVVGGHEDYAAGVAREVRMGDEQVEITLQPLSSVTGTVVCKATGEPITGFTASVLRTAFLVMKMPIAREPVESEDGAFRLAGISADSYTLQIEADGFGTATRSIKLQQGKALQLDPIELQRAASIRGVVRDQDGNPIRNALVRKRQGAMADNPMMAMLTGSSTRTYSDAEGRFLLDPMSAGRLQLLASCTGFASGRSDRLRVAPGQQLADVVIELGHGGSIRGKLACGAEQRPEDFMVLVQHQVTQNTVTIDLEPDGSFLVENLDPGGYQAQAMPTDLINNMGGMDVKPGEGVDLGKMIRQMTDSVVSERCKVRSGEETAVELDVQDLTVGAQWIVQVEIGGKRQTSGMVEAVSLETNTLRMAMMMDGVATFGRMQPGEHRLQVRSGLTMTPVGEPQVLSYPQGAEEHTSLLSLPGGELRGRVIDAESSAPLASAIVRLHHDGHGERDDPLGMCLSGADGEFVFTGLTDGVYSLVAAEPFGKEGRSKASRQSGIRVASGTTTQPVELRSQPAAGASVLVTTIDGRTIPGATVLCVDAEGRPLSGLGLTATGSDGKAWFGGMADGPARIVGRAPGLAPGASTLQTLDSEIATRFTLELAGGAPTRLSVIDANGKRLRGATLSGKFDDSPWLPAILLVQTMRQDGTFDLGPLGPGKWTFRVQHPSIGTVTQERTIRGTSPVTIVISK